VTGPLRGRSEPSSPHRDATSAACLTYRGGAASLSAFAHLSLMVARFFSAGAANLPGAQGQICRLVKEECQASPSWLECSGRADDLIGLRG
jgi:hypothetical protein